MSIDFVREIDLTLWTIANVGTIANATITLLNARNPKIDKNQRKASLVWGLYFTFMALANILNVVWRLYIIDSHGIEVALIIEKISLILLNIGWIILIGYFDTTMKFFKHPYFFYIILISSIFSLPTNFHDRGILEILYFLGIIISFSLVPLLFLFLSRKSEGVLKKNSFRIFLASAMFGIALFVQEQNIYPYAPGLIDFFNEILHIPFIVFSPILIIISTIVYWMGIWQIYLFQAEI